MKVSLFNSHAFVYIHNRKTRYEICMTGETIAVRPADAHMALRIDNCATTARCGSSSSRRQFVVILIINPIFEVPDRKFLTAASSPKIDESFELFYFHCRRAKNTK